MVESAARRPCKSEPWCKLEHSSRSRELRTTNPTTRPATARSGHRHRERHRPRHVRVPDDRRERIARPSRSGCPTTLRHHHGRFAFHQNSADVLATNELTARPCDPNRRPATSCTEERGESIYLIFQADALAVASPPLRSSRCRAWARTPTTADFQDQIARLRPHRRSEQTHARSSRRTITEWQPVSAAPAALIDARVRPAAPDVLRADPVPRFLRDREHRARSRATKPRFPATRTRAAAIKRRGLFPQRSLPGATRADIARACRTDFPASPYGHLTDRSTMQGRVSAGRPRSSQHLAAIADALFDWRGDRPGEMAHQTRATSDVTAG